MNSVINRQARKRIARCKRTLGLVLLWTFLRLVLIPPLLFLLVADIALAKSALDSTVDIVQKPLVEPSIAQAKVEPSSEKALRYSNGEALTAKDADIESASAADEIF